MGQSGIDKRLFFFFQAEDGIRDYKVTGVQTCALPIYAYRGAGRPEACYVLERIVEAGARALGMDVAELRKKNFIPKFSGAYQTLVAVSEDSRGYADRLGERLPTLGSQKFRARPARWPEQAPVPGPR